MIMCLNKIPVTKYETTSTVCQMEDIGLVTVFGIRCDSFDPDNYSLQKSCWIKDISNIEGFVTNICNRLQLEQVSLIHFRDVVEDALI